MWQSNRAVAAPRSPSVARALFAIANSSQQAGRDPGGAAGIADDRDGNGFAVAVFAITVASMPLVHGEKRVRLKLDLQRAGEDHE